MKIGNEAESLQKGKQISFVALAFLKIVTFFTSFEKSQLSYLKI